MSVRDDLRGVLPITLTPFTDDGAVDEGSIDTLVEDYLGAGDVGALEVATLLNGSEHRRNVVSNMTFRPWWLVSFHSKVMTLLPGDIISTGTPGAAHIRPDDVAGCSITGFRDLSHPVE